MGWGVLALIAVQLLLRYEGYQLAAILLSFVTPACMIAIWVWVRRDMRGTHTNIH